MAALPSPVASFRALPKSARIGILAGAAAIFLVAPPFSTVRIATLLSLGNVGAFAILAVGIVMIYRASKVLNLAHGAMVMFPPYVVLILNQGGSGLPARVWACSIPATAVGVGLAAILQRLPGPFQHRRWLRSLIGAIATAGALVLLVKAAGAGMPLVPALIIGIVAGGALGYLVERVFVRTLRGAGPTAQTVGTVAALGVVVAVSAHAKVFGTAGAPGVRVFPEGSIPVGASSIRYGEIGLFVLGLAITFGLVTILLKTDLGLVMRGTAENRRAASLMGVDPDRITALTWVLGGVLAAVSGILLGGITTLSPYVTSLQALPAFVAALLGGMASLPGAVAGAAIVGVSFAVIPSIGGLAGIAGLEQLLLALAAVGAMVSRGQRIVGGDVRSESIAAAGTRTAAQGLGGLERTRRPLMLIGFALFAALPFTPIGTFAAMQTANRAAAYSLIAVSIVILIGWVGQISLGHAAIVGISAYTTGWLTKGMGIPFPLYLPLAGLVGAGIAAMLGLVSVRVRGLFLAVATLIFSWMGSEFLFRQQWFIKHAQVDSPNIGREGTFPHFDLSQPTTLYFIAWAVVALGILAAANLRDSKTGRAFFAVQGSELAASSLGVNVARYKVIAFAVSGFLAAIAGSLRQTDLGIADPDSFNFSWSLIYVSFAVVGGLRSLPGAVGAGVVFALLDFLFLKITFLSGYLEVVSAALLTIVLLAYPGGLAGLGAQIAHFLGRRRRLVSTLGWIDRKMDVLVADLGWAKRRSAQKLRERLDAPALEELGLTSMPEYSSGGAPKLSQGDVDVMPEPAAAVAGAPLPPRREDRRIIVRSEHVTVRFGGLTAVNDVSMEVREGEIVGLIGPNGAGKTVSFNSIAGIVIPTEGTVTLYGKDVTNEPVHERARLGIARTFQVLQLFPALTVFDNLMVATHLQNDTGLFAHATATPAAVAAENTARARVDEVVALLGLHEVIDKTPGDLPFGTLRLIEVARALVTNLKFIMLDEAFSGLDEAETEALLQSLLKVRALGITILLIEHDVKLVMSVSDYVYVLDRGTLIAEGSPQVVQRDPAVIAAYLGKAAEDEPVGAGV